MSSLSLNCLSFLESNLLSIMCRPRFSVFLVFLWDYLMYSQAITLYLVSGNYMYSEVAAAPWNKYGVTIMVCIALFFPFFGLLADVWIGRYKAILVGMVLCFLSWTLGGIGFIVLSKLWLHDYILDILCSVICFASFRLFKFQS